MTELSRNALTEAENNLDIAKKIDLGWHRRSKQQPVYLRRAWHVQKQ